MKIAVGIVGLVLVGVIVAIIASGKGAGVLAALLTLGALVLMIYLGVTFGGRTTPNVEPRLPPGAGPAPAAGADPTHGAPAMPDAAAAPAPGASPVPADDDTP